MLERVESCPGGPQLLELAAGREDVELVGGATRDLLLGRAPRELDVVLDGDAPEFAATLAERLGLDMRSTGEQRAGIVAHERFGTALLWWEAGRIDMARRRSESYGTPGALPEVRPGDGEEDLLRRDFTVNAIAVGLGGARKGAVRSVPQALEDLAGARLRVLHEQSFIDDPTRLLRLGRYLARLGFDPEERTAALAAGALAAGALQTVSGGRIGMELRLALREPDAPAAMRALDRLGVLAALAPRLAFDEDLARSALALLPADGRGDLLLLASVLLAATCPAAEDPEPLFRRLLDDLQFTAGERDRVIAGALQGPALLERLDAAEAPSELYEALYGAPLEAIALAGALARRRGRERASAGAREWLARLRHVQLQISGTDLLAAGVPAGPEIGRRLQSALRRKLDGELGEDREAEVRAAVEGP